MGGKKVISEGPENILNGARNQDPAAAVSLQEGGDECQLPTLGQTFKCALDGCYQQRGLANRPPYHVRGLAVLRDENRFRAILEEEHYCEGFSFCHICGFSALSRTRENVICLNPWILD